jgi:hypothetical protein
MISQRRPFNVEVDEHAVCFERRPAGIWGEIGGKVGMSVLHVSVHIQAMNGW